MTVISLNPLPSTYHLSCLPLNYLPPSHRPSKYFHLECISSELDWKYDTHSIYTRDGSVWRLSYTLEMPPIRGCNFLYTWATALLGLRRACARGGWFWLFLDFTRFGHGRPKLYHPTWQKVTWKFFLVDDCWRFPFLKTGPLLVKVKNKSLPNLTILVPKVAYYQN